MFEARIIFAAILVTRLLGARRCPSFIRRFMKPEIT
jgi:hypothetical protein